MPEYNKLMGTTSDNALLIDMNDGELRSFHTGRGMYYGVTWDDTTIYIGSRNNQKDTDRYGDTVLTFDHKLKWIGLLPLNLSGQSHQIIWYGGTLYVADTQLNRLVIWDGKKARPFPYFKQPPDRNNKPHINSVWCDGEYLYVGEHWRRDFDSRVVIFDMKLNKVRQVDVGWANHGIYREDDEIYVISSGKKMIMTFNLETGERREKKVQLGGWIRGLCRTEDYWYIASSVEEDDRYKRYKKRADAAITIFDSDLETVLDKIDLKITGQLMEIRVMDEPDRAHNGLLCPYQWEK